MTFRRTRIADFDGFNIIYAHATVTAWNVVAGAKGTTKITLYDAQSGGNVLANPQRLTSKGHWLQDIYHDEITILEITGLTAGNHDTAIINPQLDDTDVADTALQAIMAESAAWEAEGAARRAADSATAAAASAAAVTDEGIANAAFMYAP